MDDKLLAAIEIVSGEELQTQGAKPKEYIFGRAVSQNEKEGIGSKVFSSVGGATGSKSFSSRKWMHRSIGFQFYFAVLAQFGLICIFCLLPPHYLSTALIAAEDLAAQQPAGPIDAIAIANNIAYYADGLDIYYGFVWKWEDGQGDLIERIYSAAETENEMLAPEDAERSEPYSPPRMVSVVRIDVYCVPWPALARNAHFKCPLYCQLRGFLGGSKYPLLEQMTTSHSRYLVSDAERKCVAEVTRPSSVFIIAFLSAIILDR